MASIGDQAAPAAHASPSEVRRRYLWDGYHLARAMLAPSDVHRAFTHLRQLVSAQYQHIRPQLERVIPKQTPEPQSKPSDNETQAEHAKTSPSIDADLGFAPDLADDNNGDPAVQLEQQLCAILHHDPQRYRATVRQGAKLVSLRTLCTTPSILECVQQLAPGLHTMPDGPVLNLMSPSLRFPGGYFGTPPHQDWTSIQGSIDELSVWIPLAPVSCFPLEVVPGSHRQGCLPGTVSANAYEVNPAAYPAADFVPMALDVGDVLFFSAFTVHRTGAQEPTRASSPSRPAGTELTDAPSHTLRVAMSARFDNAQDPFFVRNGYPCAYVRSVDRNLPDHRMPQATDIGSWLEENATPASNNKGV